MSSASDNLVLVAVGLEGDGTHELSQVVVTLAGDVLKLAAIEDVDLAAFVLDDAVFLEDSCSQSDSGAAGAPHDGGEIVGKDKFVPPHQGLPGGKTAGPGPV